MHLHPKRTTMMTSSAYPSFSTCSPRPIDKQQTNAHTGDRGEKKGGWEKRFEYRKMKWNHPLANDGTCSKEKEKNSQFCDVFPPPLVLFFCFLFLFYFDLGVYTTGVLTSLPPSLLFPMHFFASRFLTFGRSGLHVSFVSLIYF